MTTLSQEEAPQEIKEKTIGILDYLNFFSHIFYPHYNRPEQYGILDLWTRYDGNLYNILSECEQDKVVGITFEFFGRSTKDEVLKEIKKGLYLLDYIAFNFTEQVCSSLFTDGNHLWKTWKAAKSHPGKYFGMIGGGERLEKIVNWLEGCQKNTDVFAPQVKSILNVQPQVQTRPAQKRGIRSSGTAFAQMTHEAQARPHQVQVHQNIHQNIQPKNNNQTQNQVVSGLSVAGRSRGPPRNGVRSLAHITNIFNSA